ncbi:MAG: TetR/AcrR family transcriptional regulator [Clostridia bacterium]|nr:TetR/AcrR family transcriptional regulator [Clostridia bacterium]
MPTAAENKQHKQSRILDAATRLFLDGSVAGTAIDDVVKLAGVAKGTFYLYFRDKYDLLDQIVIRRTAEIFTESCNQLRRSAAERAMTRTEQFLLLTDTIVARLCEDRKVTALIDKRFSICFTPAALEAYPGLNSAAEYLTGLLTTPDCGEAQARTKLYILADMVGSVCCDAILSERPCTVDELLPVLHTLLKKLLGGEPA